MTNYKLTQSERLCGKTRISALFSTGNSFIVYPYRVVYRFADHVNNAPVSILVSIPKKKFKRAVKRNLIRRRIKEAYRKNKHILIDKLQQPDKTLDIAILYLDKEVSDYSMLEKKLITLLQKLNEAIHTTADEEKAPKTE